MTLDRKDYKSAIPQLEGRLAKIEKLGRDVFNKFEDIAHKTQLDAAEAEKKVLSLDYKMTTTRVQMEYQLCTTGQTPVEANWQTTMPSITYNSYQGKTLWYRSKTYVNDIIVQTTEPMTVNLMDGVYSFVNSVSGNTGWTTIDGDKIQTGMITSHNGYCYFDIDNNNFQMKDGATLAASDNALAWDGSLGTLYIKGDIELAKNGLSYLKAYLDNLSPTVRIGDSESGYMLINPGGMTLYTVLNDVPKALARFNENQIKLGDFAELSSNGLEVQNIIQLKNGNTTKCQFGPVDITLQNGDFETDGIRFKDHRHALRGGMFDVSMGNILGDIPISVGTNDYKRVTATITHSSNFYPLGVVGWNLGGTGSTYLSVFEYYLSSRGWGTCDLTVAVRNYNSSAVSATLSPKILWLRNDYGGGKPIMT